MKELINMKEYLEGVSKIEIRHYISHPEEEDIITIVDSRKDRTVELRGEYAKRLVAILDHYSE
jgi:hypothetical protein